MQIKANGIFLEVEEQGPKDGMPLILIRGLGTQLVHWTDEMRSGFADKGYRVIVFDNRDVGLSQRCPAEGVPDRAEDILARIAAGKVPEPAYHLADMARDVVGLMDALGLERAHIFGISMGGGIAQILACAHAERMLSATIVMSAASFANKALLGQLLAYPEAREAFQETSLAGDKAWGSPGFAVDAAYIRAQAGRAWDRGADPEGVNRQTLATVNAGDRRAALQAIDLPCLVIHGAEDTLVPVAAGREIADLIPGAELEVIEGMGHVITPSLAPLIVEKVDAFIRRRMTR